MDDMTIEELEALAAKDGMVLVPNAELEQLVTAQSRLDISKMFGGTWR